jgi:hypothetical protein
MPDLQRSNRLYVLRKLSWETAAIKTRGTPPFLCHVLLLCFVTLFDDLARAIMTQPIFEQLTLTGKLLRL